MAKSEYTDLTYFMIYGYKLMKNSEFSMIAWDGVGNSNWYIFDILVCYAMTYVVAKLAKTKDQWKWMFATLLVCTMVLSFFKSAYWYNTMLAYPAGFLFAEYESKIVSVLRKYYLPLLFIFAIVFVVSSVV